MARNGGISPSTNIRALELFFALYESRTGMTRAELARIIPGYAGLDEKALQETQKRDFDALTAIGVRFEEEPDPDQRGRIRIVPDSVGPGASTEFTGQQMTLIRMAFDAWEGKASTDPAVTQVKLRASSEVESLAPLADRQASKGALGSSRSLSPATAVSSTVGAPALIGGIEGSPELATILAAITHRQPITFAYTSSNGRMERGVDPWNLIIRGRSIYLWGWDHDRQDSRLFKLSRIEAPVELIGEAGDAVPAPESVPNPFDEFACEPLLWQRVESTIPFLEGCETVNDDKAPAGWRAVRGGREEWGVWAQRIIAHGMDIIPREPTALVDALREQLSIAAKLPASNAHETAHEPQKEAFHA